MKNQDFLHLHTQERQLLVSTVLPLFMRGLIEFGFNKHPTSRELEVELTGYVVADIFGKTLMYRASNLPVFLGAALVQNMVELVKRSWAAINAGMGMAHRPWVNRLCA